jgi:2-oxoacid:acceptor oxidoreductase delta subunit (pyruvate/2-ketoisovalerate family)
MKEKITFKRLQDVPSVAISLGTMLWNKTGTWRYLKPKYTIKTPPCNEACPAGNDIEGFMVLVREGKLREAWELIKEENPFPGVCGRVCFHPCEASCNRREYDEALSIQAIERHIADSHLTAKKEKHHSKLRRKEKLAVIGSGPSGLTCAYHLARMGYGVTVFESHSSPGGILRIGIPEYRLPRSTLDHEISGIESLGVEIKTNTCVGKDLPFEDLSKYQAIFIATGAHRSRSLNIEGERLEGVLSGLEFLKRIHIGEKVSLGKRIVVIGGGNVAVDVARSAWRLGAEKIQMVCLESREQMPAFPEEIAGTEAEGIEIFPSAMPLRIMADGGSGKKVEFIKANLGEPKPDGSLNPIPIPGTEFYLEADSVIRAIGEVPDLSFLPQEVSIKKGLIEVGEMGFVHTKGYFAGGDAINPYHTVAGAIGSGKRAALAIHEYLQGGWLKEKFRLIQVGEKGTISMKKYFHPLEGEANPPVVPFKDIKTEYFEHHLRISIPQLSLDDRRGGFREIQPGLKKEEAQEEAGRCFNCGVCNGCDNCWIYCPDMAVKRKKDRYEIDYDYCKGCGICFEECPRSAILFEEEGR